MQQEQAQAPRSSQRIGETQWFFKLIAQMNSEPESLITYAGKKGETSEKLTEAVNKTFGEAEIAVKEHIVAVRDLAYALQVSQFEERPQGNAGDIQSLNEVKGTSDKLAMLDRTATAADDMVKYLTKVGYTCRKELHQVDERLHDYHC